MAHDPYDNDLRRENLMQRRLRKARGEEVPDDLEDHGYDDYDADERPRTLGGYAPPRRPPAARPPAGGCSQMTLMLGLGFLAVLLVGLLMLNSMLGGIGQIFSRAPQLPDLREIVITPTPQVITGAAVVQRVRQLSRLETASYTIQTVIEIDQSQGNPIFDFFAGDALLLIAQGTVVAGVDLNALTIDDVTVAPDGRTVTLRLPPAQIFTTTLDNEATRVYSRNRGLFAPENKDLERQARQRAEQQILLAACEDGVLSKASAQAEQAMSQFLGLLDGVGVVVVPGPPAECVAP